VGWLGLGGNLDSLVQSRHGAVRLPGFRKESSVLEEASTKPMLEVAPKVFQPMVPVAGSGEPEMIQGWSPPESLGLLYLPGREGLRKALQVHLQRPRLQGERVMVFEDLFPQGVPENPEGLANGVTSLGPFRFGPQKVGQLIPGDWRTLAGHIDKESQGFPKGEGNRVTAPIQNLRGAENTECVRQKNLRLGVGQWGSFTSGPGRQGGE
jgi:hypothetical protein